MSSLVQSNTSWESVATFPSTPTAGNTLITVTSKHNDTDTWAADSRDSGGCPVDTRQLHMARNITSFFVSTSIEGKTFSGGDLHNGWTPKCACDSSDGYLLIMEFNGVTAEGYEVFTLPSQEGNGTINLGTFSSVGPNDVCVMSVIFREAGGAGTDPVVTPGGFTEMFDGGGFVHWIWTGYKIGDGAASISITGGGGYQFWGAAAVLLPAVVRPRAYSTGIIG